MIWVDMPARAQKSIWEGSKEKMADTKQSVGKKKTAVKKWKEHIRYFGLDENLKHFLSLGGKLSSNGWSGGVYYLKRTGRTTQDIWSLSFSEIKHDKQVKQERAKGGYPELGEPSAYVFGKINNLYTLQLGYGKQKLLLPGIVDDNLSVSFRYQAGFSLALLKPYYLRLVYIDPTVPNSVPMLKEEKYSNENADLFLTENRIMGASKWSKYFDGLKPMPGAFAEAAFVIEPAQNKFLVQNITIGGNIAIYTKELPIMAEQKAKALQTSVFVGLSLGKRW